MASWSQRRAGSPIVLLCLDTVCAISDAGATIHDWGGGREAFSRWLDRFYDLVKLEAPDIAAMFGG